MFERFGELGSAEEINELAEALKKENDKESLIVLAEENGIDKEDAEDFINGDIPELVNTLMAAFGKLDIECKVLQPTEIMSDWVEYIKQRCTESETMARNVRKQGKSLKGCIAELLKWSFGNQKPVDKEILEEAQIHQRCTLGIPGYGTAKKIITSYYMD